MVNLKKMESIQEDILDGVAESIFKSVKETAEKKDGIDQLIELFTGRQKVSSSPISQLASSIFGSDIAKKLISHKFCIIFPLPILHQFI